MADGDTPTPRQRARRRGGERRQVTVPDALWQVAVDRARAEGTTPNDILIALALEGARHHERVLDLRARVAAAEAAIFGRQRSDGDGEHFATDDEAMAAALAYRDQ